MVLGCLKAHSNKCAAVFGINARKNKRLKRVDRFKSNATRFKVRIDRQDWCAVIVRALEDLRMRTSATQPDLILVCQKGGVDDLLQLRDQQDVLRRADNFAQFAVKGFGDFFDGGQ